MLTPEQIITLRADVLGHADTLAAYNAGDRFELAALYNAAASPAAKAWDPAAIVDRIHDAIDYTKYTPSDAPDGTTIYQNRCAVISIKQMNVQTMLIGRPTIDATKSNVRANIKDATVAIPAGAGGNNVNPGGVGGITVLAALQRPEAVTRLEKLFSAGTQTTGLVSGEILTVSGVIDQTEFINV